MQRPTINYHKYYDSIFIVAKKVLLQAFEWLYQGEPQYVGDYLKTTPRGMKRLGAMEKAAIDRKELPICFDISFIYKLCQHTCGLAEDTGAIWNNPTTEEERNSLEHTLYLLKEKRNELSHKPQPIMNMTKEQLEKNLDELRQMCSFVIQEAAQKAGRSRDEVKRCVDQMKKDLEDIRTKPIPSGYTDNMFAIMAKQELISKHHPSPSSNTFVTPLINSQGKMGRYEMPLKNFLFWRCEDGSPPSTIIVSGDTGTGKTSLCQYVFDSWVSGNMDSITDIQEFDLVIPVQCCKVSTRDLVDFLKGFIPDTISNCGREESREFIKTLRILWVLDGFDETSLDAVEVLQEIEKQGTSNLIFITTRPQCRQELIGKLSAKDKVCQVNLSGFSDDQKRKLIKNILHEKETNLSEHELEDKMNKFLSDVRAIGEKILVESNIPLKLKLMLDLWKEGKLNKESGASLSIIYKKIVKMQSEKLQRKIKNEKPSWQDNEISRKVSNWMEILCKIAFEMTMNRKFIRIDSQYQKKLEEIADSLPISREDCLSIFLQCDSVGKSYSFSHITHQLFLGAKCLCLLIEREVQPTNLLQTLKILYENYCTHIYMMLLQVISIIALQNRALDQSICETLIELLEKCSEFNAFEVVKSAAYSQVLAKEVSKFTRKEWIVKDDDIKAAMTLMKFITPSFIKLVVYRDPKELKLLNNFISLISKRDLALNFYLFSFDPDDHYLEPLCAPDVKCTLQRFSGNLSLEGCQYLLKMPRIKFLHLLVFSNEILDEILFNIRHLKELGGLYLNLWMPFVTKPKKSHRIINKIDDFRMVMNVMDESSVEETALALSHINKQYNRIALPDVSSSSAVKFIQILDKEKVKVERIERLLKCGRYGKRGSFFVSYGQVPLIQPIAYFKDQWHNTRLETSENELGVRGLSLIAPGIPRQNVEYNEMLESSFRTIKFS